MVIEYVAVDTGTVLDTVTFAVGGVTYATGKAYGLVEATVANLGAERGAQALRSWSNGYMLTREVTA